MAQKRGILASARNIFCRTREASCAPTQDDMYEALLAMIRWTRQFKRDPQRLPDAMSDMQRAKEFSTVRFCLPRRSGHSHFIFKMLDLGRMSGGENSIFAKPVVVFPNKHAAQANDFSPRWNWVAVADDPGMADRFRAVRPDAVIVDAASALSKEEMDQIYRTFAYRAKDPDFVFVLLG